MPGDKLSRRFFLQGSGALAPATFLPDRAMELLDAAGKNILVLAFRAADHIADAAKANDI